MTARYAHLTSHSTQHTMRCAMMVNANTPWPIIYEFDRVINCHHTKKSFLLALFLSFYSSKIKPMWHVHGSVDFIAFKKHAMVIALQMSPRNINWKAFNSNRDNDEHHKSHTTMPIVHAFGGRCTCEIFSIIIFAAETIKRRMLLHLTLPIMSPAIVNQSKALECTFFSLSLEKTAWGFCASSFILLFHVDDLRNDVGNEGAKKNWGCKYYLTDASG